MNAAARLRAVVLFAAACSGTATAANPDSIRVAIRPDTAHWLVSWPQAARVPVAGVTVSNYEVQGSDDLVHWQTLGSVPARSGERLFNLQVDGSAETKFFRVRAGVQASAQMPPSEDVLGYADQFAEALRSIGPISAEEFAARYWPNHGYLDHLTWDPTTAQFWTNFNQAPRIVGYYGNTGSTPIWSLDGRLNTEEMGRFSRNGFVVSERLGGHSFADVYYRIFYSDQPVFITTDSILQAWHRSYASILGELEEFYLLPRLSGLVTALQNQLPEVWGQCGNGPLRDSLLDVDFYLATAASLFANNTVACRLGQEARVAEVLAAIASEQLQPYVLFDRRHGNPAEPALVDFSQFKPRGYYTRSAELKRYFRGMMWLARIDFRIAGNPDDPSPRELGSGIVLADLLQRADQFQTLSDANELIRVLVGEPDSLDFQKLRALLVTDGIATAADIKSAAQLEQMQERILSGRLGLQNIDGDAFYSPFGPEQLVLPRSLTVCGQRFVADSWVFNQVTFDRVLRPGKVMRRMPSALDVAFAALGNDATVPDLLTRILNPNGVPFRDGLPYQHNLAAVRDVMDRQTPQVWQASVYSMWLAALRELSKPTTASVFPEAMRTKAWAMKTLNTQLASWTHLRHDNVLYAKESYSPDILCSYPYGFVEPRVEFWHQMRLLTARAAALLRSLTFDGWVSVPPPPGLGGGSQLMPLSSIRDGETSFLDDFTAVTAWLETISAKELAQQPLTQAEDNFLKSLVEVHGDYYGIRTFRGWYPKLFYQPVRREVAFPQLHQSDEWDAQIVGVHTDQPCDLCEVPGHAGDPGGVLHEAVGNVNTLVIAVDNGPDRILYVGPVLSYYELSSTGVQRWTDEDWKNRLKVKDVPPAPEWTRDFLVPGPIDVPTWAK